MSTQPSLPHMATNLTGYFLLAMPNIGDPRFTKTLILICEHKESGTLGVVLNRPTDITVGRLLDQLEIKEHSDEARAAPVYFGGPVQTDRGFILYTTTAHSALSLQINEELALTSSRHILETHDEHIPPSRFLITLGYAGWSAGQLEQELLRNAWLTLPCDAHVIFDVPACERFDSALKLLGIDASHLTNIAGHA